MGSLVDDQGGGKRDRAAHRDRPGQYFNPHAHRYFSSVIFFMSMWGPASRR